MSNHSEEIVSIMRDIDKKIEEINPQSVDRSKLRSSILQELCVKIEVISRLDTDEKQKTVNSIFQSQLLNALTAKQKQYRK